MFEKIKQMYQEKREFKEMMGRVEKLPEDYRFVFKKIQNYMWQFATGSGHDIIRVQCDLIDLFEAGAVEGKDVLSITGSDVGAFCEDLMTDVTTFKDKKQSTLNKQIDKKINRK